MLGLSEDAPVSRVGGSKPQSHLPRAPTARPNCGLRGGVTNCGYRGVSFLGVAFELRSAEFRVQNGGQETDDRREGDARNEGKVEPEAYASAVRWFEMCGHSYGTE